ncbi:hypothetical protein QFZ81_001529 [Paenibacillus sp. V4I9]|nr:hypothetical protein [Paenibacillus sp. V4I9]
MAAPATKLTGRILSMLIGEYQLIGNYGGVYVWELLWALLLD